MTRPPRSLLRPLGVYGFDEAEPLVLAALASEDPLLLVGEPGTGKTFLLNSLSEALGLEHRHYNASLVAFDDLVGFPFPDAAGGTVSYLRSPATAWEAESILVDEINRCRPEHQNRFFSLVHERRLQGIALARLRYRWAAMNPASGEGTCSGVEPLDAALADRFAFLVKVPSWHGLSAADRRSVVDPRGDGAVSRDGGRLRAVVDDARARLKALVERPPAAVLAYAQAAADQLARTPLRLSPRRARQLARNLLAVVAVRGRLTSDLAAQVLDASLPHHAGADPVDPAVVRAAHRVAWALSRGRGAAAWVERFMIEPTLAGQAVLLLGKCPSPRHGDLAVARLLADADPLRVAAFAAAVHPALLRLDPLPVGETALQDLGAAALPGLEARGQVAHRGQVQGRSPVHGWDEVERHLATLTPEARDRLEPLFHHLVRIAGHVPRNWRELGDEHLACVEAAWAVVSARERAAARASA